MMESKFVRELIRDQSRHAVMTALATRFDETTAQSFAEIINQFEDQGQLEDLHRLAIRCATPDAFRAALPEPRREHPIRRRSRT
jgi:hypothetical protein